MMSRMRILLYLLMFSKLVIVAIDSWMLLIFSSFWDKFLANILPSLELSICLSLPFKLSALSHGSGVHILISNSVFWITLVIKPSICSVTVPVPASIVTCSFSSSACFVVSIVSSSSSTLLISVWGGVSLMLFEMSLFLFLEPYAHLACHYPCFKNWSTTFQTV